MKVVVTVQTDYIVDIDDETPWPTVVRALEANWYYFRQQAQPDTRRDPIVWGVRPLDAARLGDQPYTPSEHAREALSAIGRQGGLARSERKADAARLNGRLGGWKRTRKPPAE